MSKKPYEKLVRDNMVAVLYSPGYGSGWSTWANGYDREALVFDKDLVLAVEGGNIDPLLAICKEKYPDHYIGSNAHDLTIEWVPLGTIFEITEYDGSERVKIIDFEGDFFVA